ncbi:hypothetical protein A2419_02760 [Candidatus Adlerbacteria bacterium RIFOXYC1_FULL_48_26]|uniref:Uncharacterized protein n=1 Tax=Candidatus Adlerbacteria bacterium RIFOXYC1_FULL_48_26 TaxID=1797247 RepID=A0A1F4Y3W9_9BACT|nr:MAG: hypothetical protein A2419_02760 [Candidatus Adlerbacteria bacterium RIFOXYC1_FULL_48_26]
MTCLNATASTAAASRAPVPVTKRQLLSEGSIVRIAVPLEARKGQIEDNGRVIHYLQFKYSVYGGLINCFVHAETAEELEKYYGDTITAEASVWQKTLEDERTFIYVDLLQTELPTTHDIFFLRDYDPKTLDAIPYDVDDFVMFPTPAPLEGAVVLVPLTATKFDTPAPAQTTPAMTSTGDTGLDRLLNDGWKIEASDEKTVSLYKGEGASRKTMTHRKPQKKSKKR